jgi:hypothetical protein
MKILIYTQTDKNSPDCFRLRLRDDAVHVARAKASLRDKIFITAGER